MLWSQSNSLVRKRADQVYVLSHWRSTVMDLRDGNAQKTHTPTHNSARKLTLVKKPWETFLATVKPKTPASFSTWIQPTQRRLNCVVALSLCEEKTLPHTRRFPDKHTQIFMSNTKHSSQKHEHSLRSFPPQWWCSHSCAALVPSQYRWCPEVMERAIEGQEVLMWAPSLKDNNNKSASSSQSRRRRRSRSTHFMQYCCCSCCCSILHNSSSSRAFILQGWAAPLHYETTHLGLLLSLLLPGNSRGLIVWKPMCGFKKKKEGQFPLF